MQQRRLTCWGGGDDQRGDARGCGRGWRGRGFGGLWGGSTSGWLGGGGGNSRGGDGRGGLHGGCNGRGCHGGGCNLQVETFLICAAFSSARFPLLEVSLVFIQGH